MRRSRETRGRQQQSGPSAVLDPPPGALESLGKRPPTSVRQTSLDRSPCIIPDPVVCPGWFNPRVRRISQLRGTTVLWRFPVQIHLAKCFRYVLTVRSVVRECSEWLCFVKKRLAKCLVTGRSLPRTAFGSFAVSGRSTIPRKRLGVNSSLNFRRAETRIASQSG